MAYWKHEYLSGKGWTRGADSVICGRVVASWSHPVYQPKAINTEGAVCRQMDIDRAGEAAARKVAGAWRTVEARDLRVGMLTEGAAGAERITSVEWVNDSDIRFVVESGREFTLSYPSHVNVIEPWTALANAFTAAGFPSYVDGGGAGVPWFHVSLPGGGSACVGNQGETWGAEWWHSGRDAEDGEADGEWNSTVDRNSFDSSAIVAEFSRYFGTEGGR